MKNAIAENIALIHERMAAAARRSGRNPGDIVLMAVTKAQRPDKIIAAYEAGIRRFGENRVQEFSGKREQLRNLGDADFALIGTLQSNKVSKAIELFTGIHSVDSLRLAERINAAVEREGKAAMSIAIEINTGDSAKAGMASDSSELEELLRSAERLPHINIQGLMTIPPFTHDPGGARPYFRRLRQLRDQIAARRLPAIEMGLLSMGMSNDFDVAIEEGSTCVRIGTALFGERG
jgi:pyridoxal phosphate enzyme (YggS family)